MTCRLLAIICETAKARQEPGAFRVPLGPSRTPLRVGQRREFKIRWREAGFNSRRHRHGGPPRHVGRLTGQALGFRSARSATETCSTSLSPRVAVDDQVCQIDRRETSTCSCGLKTCPSSVGILVVLFCKHVDRIGDCRAVFETLSRLSGF